MTPNSPPKDHNPEQDSEWQYVRRKGRNKRAPLQTPTPGKPPVPRTDDLRTVAELDADYRFMRRQFDDLGFTTQLRDLVVANAESCRRVCKAINYGVGSFDPEDGSWTKKRSTYFQHTAFLIMVEEMEKLTGKKIKCFFQEPCFVKSDIDFITSLGHEVIEAPKGNALVDQDTFFFGIHLYRGLYAEALEKHLPAVYVGTDWETWDMRIDTHDAKRIELMDRLYKQSKFVKDSMAFSNTCVYWRPVDLKEEGVVKGSEETVDLKKDGGEASVPVEKNAVPIHLKKDKDQAQVPEEKTKKQAKEETNGKTKEKTKEKADKTADKK